VARHPQGSPRYRQGDPETLEETTITLFFDTHEICGEPMHSPNRWKFVIVDDQGFTVHSDHRSFGTKYGATREARRELAKRRTEP
jgi:hypothetical protein